MLFLFISLLCCFAQAAERPDEHTQPPALGLDFTDGHWRSTIKAALGQTNQVQVFYFPKSDKRYSAQYNVGSLDICGSFNPESHQRTVILPLLYVLRQECLKGYILKLNRPFPKIKDVEFRAQDAELNHYDRKPFYSQALDAFLVDVCPALVEKSLAIFDHNRDALTTDILRNILPRWRHKCFLWTVVEEDETLELLKTHKKEQEVLLMIGDVGLLWGKRTACALRDKKGEDGRSLFSFKLNATFDAICEKYPFSRQKRRNCIV